MAIIEMDFRTAVRKRPGMFLGALGSNGIVNLFEGLIADCIGLTKGREYVKSNHLKNIKVREKKFTNGLILFAAVRGQDLKYGGSWKQTLEDTDVKAEIKKKIKVLTLGFMNSNREKAEKFLWRFDETQLGSRMF